MSGENGRHSAIRQRARGPSAHVAVACSSTILRGGVGQWRKSKRSRGSDGITPKPWFCSNPFPACSFFLKLLSFAVSYVSFGDIFKWHVSRFHTFVSLVGTLCMRSRIDRGTLLTNTDGWMNSMCHFVCWSSFGGILPSLVRFFLHYFSFFSTPMLHQCHPVPFFLRLLRFLPSFSFLLHSPHPYSLSSQLAPTALLIGY